MSELRISSAAATVSLLVMTSGQLKQGQRWGKRRDSGPLQLAPPLPCILPEQVSGLQPKASFYLNKGEAIEKQNKSVGFQSTEENKMCTDIPIFTFY